MYVARKVLHTEDRVEPDGVEVDDVIGVAGLLKTLAELLKDRMAK
jgi:hypothetical protein